MSSTSLRGESASNFLTVAGSRRLVRDRPGAILHQMRQRAARDAARVHLPGAPHAHGAIEPLGVRIAVHFETQRAHFPGGVFEMSPKAPTDAAADRLGRDEEQA